MAEFLEHYGEKDERKSRLIKRVIGGVLLVLIVAGGLFFLFHNRKQKERVTGFVELLRKKQYTEAYALWGCTEAAPCRNYAYDKFLEDWGPKSKYAEVGEFAITRARSCGSGVIVYVSFGRSGEEILWVDGPQMIVGFSPWPSCPGN
ncbi:MAG: hypothetical protein ACKV22_10380 [Bryobacteraceae bacterium]